MLICVLICHLDVHIMLYITAKTGEVEIWLVQVFSWSLRRLLRKLNNVDSTADWFLYATDSRK